MKKIIIFFLILFFSGVSGTPLGAQDIQNVKNLFLELGDPKTTNAAAERILSLSAKDPAARNYAVDKLPEMIEKTTFDQVWRNAVRLAGKLKAASTAPSLMWIFPQSPFRTDVLLFGQALSLQADPVGQALCDIGDPAVPGLAELLEHGDKSFRWRVARVLWNFDSASSRKVMREDLQHETDPVIKGLSEGKSQKVANSA